MKIELKTVYDDDGYSTYECIVINGVEDVSSYCVSGSLYLKDKNTIEKILNIKIVELRVLFDSIRFKIPQSVTEWEIEFQINFSDIDYDENGTTYQEIILPASIDLTIITDARRWNKYYSIHDINEYYQAVISQKNTIKYATGESIFEDNIGTIMFKAGQEESLLRDAYEFSLREYSEISKEVLMLLKSRIVPDLLTTIFDFPEELKIASKQYLVYFSQFLADMGINADTTIKEEANKILFTVIPKDGNEALDKIKEALALYMNAPGINESEIFPPEEIKDIAVLQWEANIHHLRGQVILAQAAIQMKDATIESLQLSNYILRGEVSNYKQIEEKKHTDSEEKIAGKYVSVKKYDGKFFSIDLPAIIRKLKRKKF